MVAAVLLLVLRLAGEGDAQLLVHVLVHGGEDDGACVSAPRFDEKSLANRSRRIESVIPKIAELLIQTGLLVCAIQTLIHLKKK